MAGTDKGFVRRWSRLKQEDDRGKEQPVAEPASKSASPELTRASPEAGAAEATPAELPDIESLDKDSDFTVFLKAGVPEYLRKRALRKLWRSDPTFAIIDGLDDYDDDFTLLFTDAAVKAAKTAYEAGKRAVTPEEEGAGPETAGAGDTAARDDQAAEEAIEDPESGDTGRQGGEAETVDDESETADDEAPSAPGRPA